MSEGNGHPYSWSAIFNGYDEKKMAGCPFPVISEYLARQQFPRDQLEGARVTHIWTQDAEVSRDIAGASHIENVVGDCREMIGEVDAVLLARDDAEHHFEMSAPFIEAGLPIYIDKPVAFTRAEAARILDLQTRPNQVFSCSALGFASEFTTEPDELDALGRLKRVDARIGNMWAKYSVHVIEPTLKLIEDQGAVVSHKAAVENDQCEVTVVWESGLETTFATTGSRPTPPRIELIGENGNRTLEFKDTYAAFKAALERFVAVVRGEKAAIPREFLMSVVQIVEMGVNSG